MLRFVRRGKIPFVPLFVFFVEIVMKVSHNETVLLLKKLIMRKIVKEITKASLSMIFIT